MKAERVPPLEPEVEIRKSATSLETAVRAEGFNR